MQNNVHLMTLWVEIYYLQLLKSATVVSPIYEGSLQESTANMPARHPSRRRSIHPLVVRYMQRSTSIILLLDLNRLLVVVCSAHDKY